MFLAAFGGVLCVTFAFIRPASADTSRIVSVYADGQKRVVTVSGTTVGAALSEAGIQAGAGDLVEPKPDTVIPQGFFNVNVYRSRPVTVHDGVNDKTINTALQSPRLIAEAAGITVYPEDTYGTEVATDFTDGHVGQTVTINRATPVVISSDGQQRVVRTQQKTVGGLLDERDVALGPQDTVVPPRETAITPGLVVQINRVKDVVLTGNEPIARTVQTIKDDSLKLGESKVETEGSDGNKLSTYRVHYTNGSESSRVLLSQQITTQPVTKVMRVGTKADSDAWARLRQCESGGNYANKNNPKYRGAYQFSYSTWAGVGGTGDPADASPAEQDMRAQMLYARSGWGPWECATKLHL